MREVAKFEVGLAPESDVGQMKVRIHYKKRSGVGRHGIVRLTTATGRSALTSVLGHELDQNMILMDYDVRCALGLSKGQSVELRVDPAGAAGVVQWYFSNPDPAIKAPALIAAWSLFLGVVGIALGVVSLMR